MFPLTKRPSTKCIHRQSYRNQHLPQQGVSILAENEVLADAIRMRKDFRFLHGGIVLTPDVLGERIG